MTNTKDKEFMLNSKQIAALIQLADFKQNDVFYDLGCGEGKVVIEISKIAKVKSSIGIEDDLDSYEIARKAAINQLTKKQLKKVEILFADMDTKDENECDYFHDLSDAKVIYYSLHESVDDLDYWSRRFEKKHFKLITKDLPLVGYRSKADRSDDDCWFFMMRHPLTRMRSKKEWIESVLGSKDLTLEHIYSYFAGQLAKRMTYRKKDITDTILDLMKLVNERF